MNEMKVFTNEEFGEVRVEEIEGKPWFVGKDVADILGYQNGSRDINRHVEEEDREKIMLFDGNQGKETIIINESGLYSLILSSKLPNAKKFKKWVTSEVLPSIRQHGMYAMDDLIENPDLAINALLALKEEREKRKALEVENRVKDQQIAELQPKASYYDLVLQCNSLLSMTEIAKDYGMSAKGMNKRLHELGVEFNQSGVWFLYAKYQDQGYTQTKTQNYSKPDGTQGTRAHMYWTQKGRLFLYELLKQSGILPMIERQEIA